MAGAANVRLRCSSWPQLVAIYQRDLSRGRLFLKTDRAPRVGTPVSIKLLLPSGAALDLTGSVIDHDSGDRGTGVVVALDELEGDARLRLEAVVRTAIEHARRKSKPEPPAPAPLSADEGAPMLGAESELIEALEIELETYRRLNPFQILGLGYNADTRAVHTAFAELSKRFHPDRYVRYQSARVSELAEALFITARGAFRTLSTPGARTEALAEIRARRETREAEEAAAPDERDPLAMFPDAVELLSAERWGEAVEFFYRAAQGQRGREAARIGIELASGLRALAAGDRLEAAERFALVLERHPQNDVAARELASLRREVSTQRQSHLARLMTAVREET